MKRRYFLTGIGALVISIGLLGGTPAKASELDDLRASGAVGEAFDGYTRARADNVKDFVKSVNAKRRDIYQKRAKKEGVSAEQVGRVYAAQIIKDAPKGTYILAEDGTWSRK
ncbi:YdbL family protein [Sneathiella limimaris]|uniref:YdbL family protein n=1 Tax=Sneathiella limimaris TaxID=1964213 RepID=UPI00146EE118|nr:YdbL family protein [Sneathiella limimaris]